MPYKNIICKRGPTCHFARAGECTYAHLELGDKIGDWCPWPATNADNHTLDKIYYEVLPDNTLFVKWFGHSSGKTVRVYCKGLTGTPCFSQDANLTLTPDDEKRYLENVRYIITQVKTGKRPPTYKRRFRQAPTEDKMLEDNPSDEPKYSPNSHAIDFSNFSMFKPEKSGFEKSLNCFGGKPPQMHIFSGV